MELTYTAWDLQPFARDLGYDGPPFKWDEDRRALLRAELDAYYAALYGLTRDELRYILDPQDVYGPDFPGETFRVLKEREIKEYGEYRTRRLVLEAWDRLDLEPRNRDGRYPVEAAETAPRPPRDQAAPVASMRKGERPADGRKPVMAPEHPSSRGQTSSSDGDVSRPADGAVAASQVRHPPKPQPNLPGLQPAAQPAPAVAKSASADPSRQEHLERILQVLRRHGPMHPPEIAEQLRASGPSLDKNEVFSILSFEGAGRVERDPVTRRFRVKP